MRRLHLLTPLLLGLAFAAPTPVAHAQIAVGLSITIAPPILPIYVQPEIPAPGYIWTPGYWAYGTDGYYWVPGTWVQPPAVGLLWTPGYWGWHEGFYGWNAGYWGPHVGFYGGVNYGFGYGGAGYEGGYWNHGAFTYNRSINHLGGGIHNVYERNVDRGPDNRVAFNGGNGIHAEATANERIADHERHIGAVPLQQQHQQAAAGNRAQFANVNHGQPAVAATQRPGAQAFHQAMAHPDNAQAVQAARTAPRTQNAPQSNARPAVNNRPAAVNQPQAHQQPQQQARPQPQAQPRPQVQQARPQPQARPAAPAPQARPQGGGGEQHGGGGGQPHGDGGRQH